MPLSDLSTHQLAIWYQTLETCLAKPGISSNDKHQIRHLLYRVETELDNRDDELYEIFGAAPEDQCVHIQR